MTDHRRPLKPRGSFWHRWSVRGQRDISPTCAFANGSCRRPPHPSSETSRTIPSRNKNGGEILLRADGRPASATRWPLPGTPAHRPGPGARPGISDKPGSAGSRPSSLRPPADTRLAFLGSTCTPRATLTKAAGDPRRAVAWETEARCVPALLARIVNTEGPRP
jgi:hypothetical protein